MELVDGICDLAAERYGLLGGKVLAYWGPERSEDLGEVTFHLVEAGVFGKRPEDSIEDFAGGPRLSPAIETAAMRRIRSCDV